MAYSAPSPSDPRLPGAQRRTRFAVWADALIAVVAVAYTLPLLPAAALSAPPWASPLLLVLTAVIGAALPFRRRAPLAVLAVMILAMSAHAVLGAPLLAVDVLALPALYSLAALRPPAVSLPGALAVLAWLLATTLPRLGEEYLNPGEVGLLCVVVAWVWTWGTLVRIRRAHLAGLREHALRLEREQQVLAEAAVAEERARIAREMHDIVSHSLSVVVVMSEGAAATVETDPGRAREAMLRVRDTGRSALADMRTMLGVLRGPDAGEGDPQPGLAQLPDLVAESRAAGLPVELAVTGGSQEMSTGLEATFYRIVQEALTNARRHAGPDVARVEVALDIDDALARVRISDDGRGPDPRRSRSGPATGSGRATSSGLGLRGIRERVAASGGTVSTGAREGGGFEIIASIPLRARAGAAPPTAHGPDAAQAHDAEPAPDDDRTGGAA